MTVDDVIFELGELRDVVEKLRERIVNLEVVEKARKPIKPRYVYLMRDNNNNRYKIGFSVDPNRRERTLQSESPDIELLGYCREGGGISEKSLQMKYRNRRYRGEWYNLVDSEVYYILGLMEERLNNDMRKI